MNKNTIAFVIFVLVVVILNCKSLYDSTSMIEDAGYEGMQGGAIVDVYDPVGSSEVIKPALVEEDVEPRCNWINDPKE
jgi:hypothetical protein